MKKIYLFASFLFLSIIIYAANPLEDFLQNKLLVNANVSLLIKDANTSETLHQFRSKNAQIPASTMKLVTTASALEILGADFRFKTLLATDGVIGSDNVLNGDLYIIGGGDPTLGSQKLGDPDFMKYWISAVKLAGIKRITGTVKYDSSIFDNDGVSPFWSWEDIGNYYSAGAYGIAYLDNTFRLYLKSGKVGTTPLISKTVPEIPFMLIDNQLISTNIGFDSAYFYGAPLSNNRTLKGEIPANNPQFIVKGEIPDPGLLLAQKFYNELIRNAVSIDNQPIAGIISTTKLNVLYTQKSPQLSEIIKETNVNSNNLYAEHLFRYLGANAKNQSTSVAAINTIINFWKSKKIPVDQLFMKDGCGLSPSNAVSAEFFVDLLQYMYTSKNKNVFYNSLPISGVSGTLKSFLDKSSLAGKVHAKSGTISRVKSYAGYVERDNKTYVFAVIVNNANGKSIEVTRAIENLLLSL